MVVDLAALESVSFFLGKIMTGVEATWSGYGPRGGASTGTGVRRLGKLSATPPGFILCMFG